MRAIGVAGTAKNTGKTTTALEIIRQSAEAGLRTALTSIGYDGEDKDTITGLPKPRYYLPPGMYVATSERCLRAGSAGYTVKAATTVRTILGRIVVAEIDEPGLVVVAGPNRGVDLRLILDIFENLGTDLAIVDGALNRIVPMISTDGLVLATGAALDERIACVARHARAIHEIFAPGRAADSSAWGQRISIRADRGHVTELETGSLLGEDTALQIHRLIHGPVRDLVIPGACDPRLIERLLDHGLNCLREARLVLGSPLKLLASGDPLAWSSLLTEAYGRGQLVEYIEKIPLLFMTVNPFYPRYLPYAQAYEPANVNKCELLAAVQDEVPGLPVFDIKQPPGPDLLSLLHRSTKGTQSHGT